MSGDQWVAGRGRLWGNSNDWQEEVESVSSLRWYRMAKDDGRSAERYVKSMQGQEGVRLRFRLRTGSAGLGHDKRRCGLWDDNRYVLCGSGEEEDVDHFLVACDEFDWERQVLLAEVGGVEGAKKWMEEFQWVNDKGKVAMLLGKGVEGVDGCVMEKVDDCVDPWNLDCKLNLSHKLQS